MEIFGVYIEDKVEGDRRRAEFQGQQLKLEIIHNEVLVEDHVEQHSPQEKLTYV